LENFFLVCIFKHEASSLSPLQNVFQDFSFSPSRASPPPRLVPLPRGPTAYNRSKLLWCEFAKVTASPCTKNVRALLFRIVPNDFSPFFAPFASRILEQRCLAAFLPSPMFEHEKKRSTVPIPKRAVLYRFFFFPSFLLFILFCKIFP